MLYAISDSQIYSLMKTEQRNNILQFIIGIPILALILYVGYSYHTTRIKNIKSNCSLTLGEIQDVNDVGVAFDVSLEYEYFVKGDKFERTVEISSNDKRNFKRW